MNNINNLEKRIAALEANAGIGIDLEQAAVSALGILNDTELGILDEYMSLVHSGFGTSEIENMMGLDSYQAALAAVEKADMEYNRITTPPARPKRRGKPLELPKEHCYNECGLGVREDAKA